MIKNGGSVIFMEDRGVPYLVLGNQWVSFENEKSVTLKVSKTRKSPFESLQ